MRLTIGEEAEPQQGESELRAVSPTATQILHQLPHEFITNLPHAHTHRLRLTIGEEAEPQQGESELCAVLKRVPLLHDVPAKILKVSACIYLSFLKVSVCVYLSIMKVFVCVHLSKLELCANLHRISALHNIGAKILKGS